MADVVGNEGSPTAPIILIGEAPGRWEHIYSRPFVGPSYTDRLQPWWRDCVPAIVRERDVFITNVLDYQPAAIDRASEAEMRAAFDRLHALIASLPGPDGAGPRVIVPTGNYALYALTGKGKVSFHRRDGKWERPGITSLRGSVLAYEDQRGRTHKVIPTIHPAASMPFRSPWYEKPCRADWQRIATDAAFRELRLPQRNRMVARSRGEAIEWLRWTRDEAAKMAREATAPPATCAATKWHAISRRMAMSLDVETPKRIEYETRQRESIAATAKCATCGHTRKWHFRSIGEPDWCGPCTKKALKRDGGRTCTCASFLAPMGKARKIKTAEYPYLACIGYSWDPASALCIPTTAQHWHDPADLAAILTAMRDFHADENIDFFGQNFTFDAWWCATEGMPITNIRWDLMKMHRVRCPDDEQHDLAYQASIYTREPYWKDEAKDPDSVQRYAFGDALFLYNCTDNCVQRELLPLHHDALLDGGRLAYYEQMEAPMDVGLVELSLHGMRTDEPGRAEEYERVRREAGEVADAIERAAGVRLVAKTAVSTKKMQAFLYGAGEGELRLPPQYITAKDAEGNKKKRVSTNVVTIKRLMERYPAIAVLQTVGALVLRHRRLNTIANYVKLERTTGGRQYAMFKQDTALGRLSSGKNPKGEGANLQNVDRKLRKFYLPDTGEERV